MENDIENNANITLSDVTDYKFGEKVRDLVKSDSNELDNTACCHTTGPDIQHIDSSGDKKSTNIAIDQKFKTSSNMSDLEYDFKNVCSTIFLLNGLIWGSQYTVQRSTIAQKRPFCAKA